VYLGSVPLGEGFLREKLGDLAAAEASCRQRAQRLEARSNPSAAAPFRRLAETYGLLLRAGGGEPMAAKGRVGEGLEFVIDRIEVRAGVLVFGVRPGGVDDPSGQD
jgi:hypothetical protein